MRPVKTTRERLLGAGLRLFAERGFRRTTVGDIETAAGLAPRSGGLYKHFASKQELLAAAVERHLHEIETIRGVLDLMPLGDLRAELTLLARWILGDLSRHRELFLVFEKEGDNLSELKERYYADVGAFGYSLGADYVRRAVGKGGDLDDLDAEALAAVAMNALVNHRRSEWTFGHRPLDLEDDRVVQGVVEVVMRFAERPRD